MCTSNPRKEFPLVVVEAGFSEHKTKLFQDTPLWLHGSHATVSFVLFIIITESKSVYQNQNPKQYLNNKEVEERLVDGQRSRRVMALNLSHPHWASRSLPMNCSALMYGKS